MSPSLTSQQNPSITTRHQSAHCRGHGGHGGPVREGECSMTVQYSTVHNLLEILFSSLAMHFENQKLTERSKFFDEKKKKKI